MALHKEAMWFWKGVGGVRKGELKAVNVLAMIRQRVSEADFQFIASETGPAVAGSDSQSSADAVDDDPMEAMVALCSVAEALSNKSCTKKRKVDRASVQELQVPTRPPCVSAADDGQTTIFVYTPPAARKNRVPHLRVDCIPWLLAYAADELACHGVSCCGASSDGTPQNANCAIDNVNLEWNFSSKTWVATFVGGHAQGTVVEFGPHNVTPALLKKLRVLELANGWYSKSSSYSNKSAAKEYILIWCSAIHDGKIAEHFATFEGLLSIAPKQRDGTNSANSASDEDADDGDLPATGGASDDEACDAAAAEVSAAAA